ncbi:RHS repeat-associated core domain-containing protein [Congzhengia sp.]|uniref:RHS repeat-associated core domain-containing protein n=1 Tax=Congzhengia sp. TaxID=2944168 RepID=UPI0030785038
MVGLGGIVARKTTGTPMYLFKDVHGDTTMLMQGTSQKGTYDYDAYGKQTDITGTADNPYRYCGEYTDEETGFIYLRNRYYDPSIGRFISEDPAKSGSKWYVYCENNPVKFVDPWGLKPTREEAAHMSEHIYHHDKSELTTPLNVQMNNEASNWYLIDVWYGREGLKMGFYAKLNSTHDWSNPLEYCVVFKGTSNLNNWINNAEAYLGTHSADMWDAMNFSLGFVNSHSGYEITFAGHSKGGGEAIAAATYTHRDAITFNAANFNFQAYGLIEADRTGNFSNYYVVGEIISQAIETADIGNTIWLSTQYYNKDGKIDRLANHGMSAIFSAFNKR